MKKYYFTYNIIPHPEGITKAQIPPDHGAADALVLVSIIQAKDGSVSYATQTTNGQSDLHDNDLFMVWANLTHQLSQSQTIGSGKKAICEEVFRAIRELVLNSRLKTKLWHA